MSRRAILLIPVLILLSFAGLTSNPTEAQGGVYDWCYHMDMREMSIAYGKRIPVNSPVIRSTTRGEVWWEGFDEDEQSPPQITFSYQWIKFVTPSIVTIQFGLIPGYASSVNLLGYAELFGLQGPIILENVTGPTTLAYLTTNPVSYSSTINVNVIGTEIFTAEAISVYGNGESPWPETMLTGTVEFDCLYDDENLIVPTPLATYPLQPTPTPSPVAPTPSLPPPTATDTNTPGPTATATNTSTPSPTPSTFCHTFDFTLDTGGFSGNGWAAGEGFKGTTYYDQFGGYYGYERSVSISRVPLSMFQPTSLRMVYSLSRGTSPSGNMATGQFSVNTNANGTWYGVGSFSNGSSVTSQERIYTNFVADGYTGAGYGFLDGIGASLVTADYSSGAVSSAVTTIHLLEVCGLGPDPFPDHQQQTSTPTNTPSLTPSATFTASATSQIVPVLLTTTLTPFPTTQIPTRTRTPTRTPSQTFTPRPTRTQIPVLATFPPTSTPIPTNTLLPTATRTPTRTPLPFPTPIPTIDPTVVTPEEGEAIQTQILAGISNALQSLIDWMVNSGQNFADWVDSLINYINGSLVNLGTELARLLEPIKSLFDFAAAVAGQVGQLFQLVSSIGTHLFETVWGFVGGFTEGAGNMITAFVGAEAQALPGVPKCQTRPMDSELCAVWYILQHTVFSGPFGSLLIPLLTILIDLTIFLIIVLQIRNLLSKGQSVT